MQTADDLALLEAAGSFRDRHIGPRKHDIAHMLAVVGAGNMQDLIGRTIPAGIRLKTTPVLPTAVDEAGLLADLADLAAQNDARTKSLIGCGYYGTHTPPVILRNVLENPGWYTAYTPYQSEISQGRLEALLNFQTMIADLTGLPIANASLLDEATAAAEGVAMAKSVSRAGSTVIALAADLHPQTRAVIATRAHAQGWTLRDVPPADAGAITATKPFAVVLQSPGTTGALRCLRAEIAAAHAAGALAIVAADLLSLTLLTPPGEMGADVVVGSTQRFGVPMGFGGPHAAFFATSETFRRNIPGRIVGRSIDASGAPALRLALQTREQHIRREKATSNICTAQVLLAIIAGFYAVWHGPEGLRSIASRINLQARLIADCARRAGFTLLHSNFFDTITIATGEQTASILREARTRGFNLREPETGTIALSLDETVTRAEFDSLCALFGSSPEAADDSIPENLGRVSPYLTHPVFHAHRSEHAMLRYLKTLEDKDFALNRGMIPLGSCTMKLNATAEMIPITWPGFANIHPFAPAAQTQGYATVIGRLQTYLAAITGFAAVSLQPNAGSQGELAGLLAIRAYHAASGEPERTTCLIPSSAHGTNPASAAMAGLKIVVVGCDKAGNIDLADLRAKAGKHADTLAALMITYPSTHGVFEDGIREVIDIVHAHGGQVYMDGANMNAQVGLTSPAAIGADVCHLNLHKTFCIPHGGGGPGVGPIAVAAHLAPHLPNHPARADAGPLTGIGPIAAAPFGSAGILPISYAYIRMMGADGLRRATETAILSANYIAARLGALFPVLYSGQNGTVAHECILDCRGFAGIQVEDIAKRLQDYGFHAPTMSWPVPGTLMVEPTESEPLEELDRFCDAMIAIHGEIKNTPEVLKTAPHPGRQGYAPPVNRVDNAHGDRNLLCTCPSPAAYAEAAE
jgi:glycine dehydrogenase